jgi:O-antigen/teichoic acid export membrane protein
MKIAKMKIPELISSIAYFVFSLIVIFIYQNFYWYLVANIIEASIKALLLFVANKEFKITKINFELVKKYIKSNNYFLIPIILNTFSVNIGIFFFLRYYDHDLLGVYSVITHFFLLLISLENSFRLFLIPNLSSLYEKREFLKMENFINGYKKYMLILNSLIVIGGIIFSEFVINLFMGELYYDLGLNLYYCNLLALLLIPLYGSYSPLIIASNKLKFYSLLSIITFLFSLISWIFFIPIIGMIGIKAGLWIYQIFGIFIIRKFLIKKYNIGRYKKDEIFHFIFLCIIIVVAFLITLLDLGLILSAVSFIGLSLFYFGFLYFSKYFTKEDFLYIMRSINPKEMVVYIRNETMEKK